MLHMRKEGLSPLPSKLEASSSTIHLECHNLWVSGPKGPPRDSSAGLQNTFLASAGLGGAHWPEEFVSGGTGSSSDCSSNIVGRRLSGIEPLHVTAMAEQVSIQREAAAAFLITQLHPAVLTVVALKMIISVHGNHPHNVLTAL